MNPNTLQTYSQIAIAIGIVLTAIGGYSSYHFGKIKDEVNNKLVQVKIDEAKKERKEIVEPLKKYIQNIKDIRTQLVQDMYFIAVTQNNGEVNWPVSEQDLSLENHYPDEQRIIVLTNNLPLEGRRFTEKNWFDRLYRIKEQIQPECDAILRLDNNLKANEIVLIVELRDCALFSMAEKYKNLVDSGRYIANENISFMRSEIQEFLFLTESINKEILNKI